MNIFWKQIRLQSIKYSVQLPYLPTKSFQLSLDYSGKFLIPKIIWHSFHDTALMDIRFNKCSVFFRSSSTHLSCWNCASIYEISSVISSSFCLKCKKILPVDKCLNYFEIFGLEQGYEISKSSLTLNFRKLQSKFHPDKFSIMPEREQKLAEEHSSFLNKAYSTLSHPVERAEYLLMLSGLAIEEQEVKLTMEPEFLMQIMDINEALVDADDTEIINDIARRNKVTMEELMRDANSAFLTRNLPEAKKIVAKMKYYNNLYEKIKECELQYGIVH